MNKSLPTLFSIIIAFSILSSFSFADESGDRKYDISSCGALGSILIYDINRTVIIGYCVSNVLEAASGNLSATQQNEDLVIEKSDSTDIHPKVTSELENQLRGLEVLLEQEQPQIEKDEAFIEVEVRLKQPSSVELLPDYVQVTYQVERFVEALVPIGKIYELESDPNVTRISSVERGIEFSLPNNIKDKSVSIQSPKQQMKEGISPENVICREGLELIFKSSNNSPACVKPETKIKLIERGWGIITN